MRNPGTLEDVLEEGDEEQSLEQKLLQDELDRLDDDGNPLRPHDD